MKAFKRVVSLILTITVIVCTMSVCAACSNKEEGKTVSVHYTNASNDDLLHMDYVIKNYSTKTTGEMIDELIDQMFVKDYTEEHMFSAKPDALKMNGYYIDQESRIVVFDFSQEYLEMTNVKEIIFRACVVLTIIQLDGVNGVNFTVNGEPITYSDGNIIGTMSADDFVNILLTESGMLKQETDVTLYFANSKGTGLVPVTSHFITSNNNTSVEEYIVQQLISGPKEGVDAYPTISKDVELISVVSSDNICYVNFGESFLEQDSQPVSDELLIYSIVNSLCRLAYIDSVQFLINGESSATLHTITDLSMPFSRNASLVDNSAY